ncbi:MAG: hypothetical protein HYY16_14665 [Planctomycetes bacterium]|nr:hypothetical protein [Planctomycetota bacterium]
MSKMLCLSLSCCTMLSSVAFAQESPAQMATNLTDRAIQMAQEKPQVRELFRLRAYRGSTQAADLSRGASAALGAVAAGFFSLSSVIAITTAFSILEGFAYAAVFGAIGAGLGWVAYKMFRRWADRRAEAHARREGIAQFIDELLTPLTDEDRAVTRSAFKSDEELFETMREQVRERLVTQP